MAVYFDNAATTPLDEQVIEAMLPYMRNNYGNPSSTHTHGRQVRSAIEKARKKVAELLNTSPAEIFFTSGGTEADNMALCCMVDTYGIENIITSKIEHHAVLHTVKHIEKAGRAQVHFVDTDKDNGNVSLQHLEHLLKTHPNAMVSLMHGNNEIGNLTDIGHVAELCVAYGAKFHSDTVQTMGHYRHDLQKLSVDCLVGSAHKFHGPKGVGFLYVNHATSIQPLIYGGAQERNMRGGTENVYGIIGLAKALEVAYTGMESHKAHIMALKQRMMEHLTAAIPTIGFNGTSGHLDQSLYTVLNLCMPDTDDNDMLLFNLDIQGISASGGSACSSGSSIGSHVLNELDRSEGRGSIRISFSKYNTEEEVDYVCQKLAELYPVENA